MAAMRTSLSATASLVQMPARVAFKPVSTASLVGVKRKHFFSRIAFVGNVVPFLDGHENVVFPIYNTGRLLRKHRD